MGFKAEWLIVMGISGDVGLNQHTEDEAHRLYPSLASRIFPKPLVILGCRSVRTISVTYFWESARPVR